MLPQSTLRRYTVNLDEESGTGAPSAAERATPTITDTEPIAAEAPPTTNNTALTRNSAAPTTANATSPTANATSPTTDAPPKIDAAPTTNDTPPTATSAPPPTLTLHTPAQISALALVPHNICADTLIAGSADGTLRVYDLTSGRVTRAVRGLGDEVASIAIDVPAKKAKSTDDASKEAPLRAWVACGRKILHFDLSPTAPMLLSPNAPMLQTAKDALAAVDVCEEDEGDAVNGVSGRLPRVCVGLFA
ncbi:hypothetical protein K523DRAFT_356639 [Schizophyllum commune Tattone D]|nr:hypothetical protein K523DRAFT_356639 [Schizophyllum commune Tattone D]